MGAEDIYRWIHLSILPVSDLGVEYYVVENIIPRIFEILTQSSRLEIDFQPSNLDFFWVERIDIRSLNVQSTEHRAQSTVHSLQW